MNVNKKQLINAAIYLYMVLITLVVTFFATNLRETEPWNNEKIGIMLMSSGLYLIFMVWLIIKKTDIYRCLIVYHIVLLSTVIMMLVPFEFRPIMLIFMILSMYMGMDSAIVASFSAITAVSYVAGISLNEMYIMLITSILACFATRFVKNYIYVSVMSVIYILGNFVINEVVIYYSTDALDMKQGLINMTATIITLIVFINIYVITKPKNVKQYITDDFALIREIKESSMSLYYHSAEVAELSVSAAKAIGEDMSLAYAGGMYHDVGKLERTTDYVKCGLRIANEFDIPNSIKAIMVEHNPKHRKPATKIAAIVMLSDSVISSIEHLKNNNKDVEESKIIDNVFNMRLNAGALSRSGLSVAELTKIKEVFASYYGGK